MTQNARDTHVQIRPLRAEDRAAWAKLWTAYLAFYETDVPQDVYDATFERLIDPAHDRMFAHIAERDGHLVGLVHYLLHDHCWRLGQVCYLQDLFADPAVRGTGVGRALIESVYDAADRLGAESTYWLTQEFNREARQLYDRIAQVTPFIKYQRA